MAIVESAANNESIRKFLVFMESDTKGAIIIEKSSFLNVIQLFLDKKTFAMNFYGEFIKTSACGFPSINSLINTIDEANQRCKTLEQKSHFFCMDMWMYIYH
jgi:hypothetical protein